MKSEFERDHWHAIKSLCASAGGDGGRRPPERFAQPHTSTMPGCCVLMSSTSSSTANFGLRVGASEIIALAGLGCGSAWPSGSGRPIAARLAAWLMVVRSAQRSSPSVALRASQPSSLACAPREPYRRAREVALGDRNWDIHRCTYHPCCN
jgi:hypothetical protein